MMIESAVCVVEKHYEGKSSKHEFLSRLYPSCSFVRFVDARVCLCDRLSRLMTTRDSRRGQENCQAGAEIIPFQRLTSLFPLARATDEESRMRSSRGSW